MFSFKNDVAKVIYGHYLFRHITYDPHDDTLLINKMLSKEDKS